MHQVYTPLKINNEIELCEIRNNECKKLLEKALLKNRISYFIKWTRSGFVFNRRERCIICVNENDKIQTSEIIRSICEEHGYKVRFLVKLSDTKANSLPD